jgi:hypothetical protein
MTTPTKPTRVSVGSVRKDMLVRLANRPTDFAWGPEWVRVTSVQVVPAAAPTRGQRDYRVSVAWPQEDSEGTREYGVFGQQTRFEIRPELAVQAPSAAGPKTPKVSLPVRTAMQLLAHNGGELTRETLHADPMVVVALERRGWASVDRSGTERKIDLVELTEAGREWARAAGYGVPAGPVNVPGSVAEAAQEFGTATERAAPPAPAARS